MQVIYNELDYLESETTANSVRNENPKIRIISDITLNPQDTFPKNDSLDDKIGAIAVGSTVSFDSLEILPIDGVVDLISAISTTELSLIEDEGTKNETSSGDQAINGKQDPTTNGKQPSKTLNFDIEIIDAHEELPENCAPNTPINNSISPSNKAAENNDHDQNEDHNLRERIQTKVGPEQPLPLTDKTNEIPNENENDSHKCSTNTVLSPFFCHLRFPNPIKKSEDNKNMENYLVQFRPKHGR